MKYKSWLHKKHNNYDEICLICWINFDLLKFYYIPINHVFTMSKLIYLIFITMNSFIWWNLLWRTFLSDMNKLQIGAV